jgi:hypothetical protein
MTTKITSTAIVNSTIDNTIIGGTTPANATLGYTTVGMLTGPIGSVLTIRPSSAGAANTIAIQNFAGTVNYFLIDSSGNISTPGPLNVNGQINAASLTVSGGTTLAGANINGVTNTATLTNSGALTTAGLVVNISAQAPTVAATDSSTNVATTAWVRLGFAVSIGTNGYIRFPSWLGGLLFQWGQANAPASSVAISFPTAFSSLFNIQCMSANYGPNAGRDSQYIVSTSATAFTVGCGGSTISTLWFAIGN